MDHKKIIQIAIVGQLFSDQRIQRIAKTLQSAGYGVNILYRNHQKFGKQGLINQTYPFETKGLSFIFNKGALFYLVFNLRLFFSFLFKKIDILYAVDSDTLLAFTLLSIIKKKPLIYDAHEYFAEVPELENQGFKKQIWHKITQWGINKSVLNITVSATLAKELENKYGKPFITVRNVPFLVDNLIATPFETPTIIYQGALNKGRCLELLLETMKNLPLWNCIIVGEGDLSETLRKKAASEGIKNVSFAGLLSPDELKTLTPKCYCAFNLLSSNSLSYYFSLSNKFFDYIHAEIPSISSLLPEYMALNGTYKTGLCIENNTEALTLALKQLEDKNAYQKLKENTIIAKQKLNWQIESELLLKKIGEI